MFLDSFQSISWSSFHLCSQKSVWMLVFMQPYFRSQSSSVFFVSGLSIFSSANCGDNYGNGFCFGLWFFFKSCDHLSWVIPSWLLSGLHLDFATLRSFCWNNDGAGASSIHSCVAQPDVCLIWIVVDGSAAHLQAGKWLKWNLWLCLTPWSLVSSLDILGSLWQFAPSPHI